MNKLIWYSIPGAMLIVALFLIDISLPEHSLIVGVILGIPLIGFLVHQISRFFWEFLIGGYNNHKRKINIELRKEYNLNKDQAYLLWELTLYSSTIHKSFRDHDRGAWHYIMSFYSCGMAAFISVIILACFYCRVENVVWWIVGYVVVGGIIVGKGILTQNAIGDQEIGISKIHKDVFWKNSFLLK